VTDGRDAARLERSVGGLGAEVVALPGDVTDPRHRQELISAAGAELALVVNNAGTLGPSPLPALTSIEGTALAELYRVNVVAPVLLIQAALPRLRANAGVVVNVTSDAGIEAYEGWGGYGSSKAALEHLSRVLAIEEPSIRFWALDPGDMRTDMHQAAFPGEDISDRPLPEVVAPAVQRLLELRPPSGRVRAADLLGVRP
jgi:NAD(P)-dependent dehydrogenase (short-subunit alcohol dehydrogenase family)